MKLREMRLSRGVTQAELANIIGSHAPTVSMYEAGTTLPSLEEAQLLEKFFAAPIDWCEEITPSFKRATIQSLITLCEHYPIEMVMEFTARVYRRKQSPERLIIHYAKLVSGEEPMLPTI